MGMMKPLQLTTGWRSFLDPATIWVGSCQSRNEGQEFVPWSLSLQSVLQPMRGSTSGLTTSVPMQRNCRLKWEKSQDVSTYVVSTGSPITFLTVSNIVRNLQAVRFDSNIHTQILC